GYFEVGLFQITLCYPINTGPAAAEAQAQLTRAHFKRGVSMVHSGITVVVMDTPRVAPALIDGDRFCIPLTVPFQAQIST
ncbi:phage tail terminator-like protein, partial [Helicobacter pylori]|uniref:phage tail terminator-like protein n=1 Tax=Helicobacter pylori TaxID=210 RepID=UPI002929BEF3